jgi:hypothetical protein
VMVMRFWMLGVVSFSHPIFLTHIIHDRSSMACKGSGTRTWVPQRPSWGLAISYIAKIIIIIIKIESANWNPIILFWRFSIAITKPKYKKKSPDFLAFSKLGSSPNVTNASWPLLATIQKINYNQKIYNKNWKCQLKTLLCFSEIFKSHKSTKIKEKSPDFFTCFN